MSWESGLDGRDDGTGEEQPSVVSLSPGQRELMKLHHTSRDGRYCNVAAVYEVRGPLSYSALKFAVEELLVRHRALRWSFDGEKEVVCKAETVPDIVYEDVSCLSAGERSERARDVIERNVVKQFNIAQPPLLRVVVVKMQDERCMLAVVAHTLVADWRSLSVLISELGVLYRSEEVDEAGALSQIPGPCDDLMQAKERSGDIESVVSCVSSGRYDHQMAVGTIEPRLRKRIDAYCMRNGIDRHHLLMAALCVVVYRHTKLPRVNIGMTAGKAGPGDSVDVVCPMIVVHVGVRVDESMSVSDVVTGVRAAVPRARDRAEVAMGADAVIDCGLGPIVPVMELTPDLEVRALSIWRSAGAADLLVHIDDDQEAQVAVWPGKALTNVMDSHFWDHYLEVLARAMELPGQCIGALPMLSGKERKLIRQSIGKREQHEHVGVHRRIERYARQRGDRTALVCGKNLVTFEQLNKRANMVAHLLRWNGATRGTVVGVAGGRSVDTIVLMLAVLKAGCIYLPLITERSSSELNAVITDAMPQIVLTDRNVAEQLNCLSATVVFVNEILNADTRYRDDDLPLDFERDDPAYLMYKRGEDGKLIGVRGTHGAISNLVVDDWCWGSSGLIGGGSLWSDLDEALSLWEVFTCLGSGRCLHVVPAEIRGDASAYISWLDEQRIDSAYIPINAMSALRHRAISEHSLRLKKVLTERGDFAWETVKEIKQRVPGLTVAIGYGCLETGVITMLNEVNGGGWSPAAVGRPIVNTAAYVVDQHGQLAPVGVCGELFIGGDGVSSGYLHRPELTRRMFVVDPFSYRPGARMFRTGDGGRYMSGGGIELLADKGGSCDSGNR